MAAVLFALQQFREEFLGIAIEDVWRAIPGIPSLGFQLSHIAGSLDWLTTYLAGGELTESQLAFLSAEGASDLSRQPLMAQVEAALQRTEATLRAIDPATYSDARYVGRKRIPTTVIGLAIHIAEHTQRHCGQAITTSKLLVAHPNCSGSQAM
jgi:DinB superfamily